MNNNMCDCLNNEAQLESIIEGNETLNSSLDSESNIESGLGSVIEVSRSSIKRYANKSEFPNVGDSSHHSVFVVADHLAFVEKWISTIFSEFEQIKLFSSNRLIFAFSGLMFSSEQDSKTKDTTTTRSIINKNLFIVNTLYFCFPR